MVSAMGVEPRSAPSIFSDREASRGVPSLEFPRVLFVTSAAFNHVTGGGITFSNLFQGWPADRLAAAHNDPVPTSDDVCRTYYRLGGAEIARWPRALAGRNDRATTPSGGGAARCSSTARRVKDLVVGNAWPDCGRLTPALEDWIAAFRPSLLYTILGTIGMQELVDAIRRRFDLPLVVHFMDDWASHIYRGGALSILPNARMTKLLRRLIDSAADRLAIGEDMAAAYERRYGRSFAPFQNAVDLGAVGGYLDAGRQRGGADSPIKVLYVGSVFSNAQLASLLDIGRAVSTLAAEGLPIQFDIHSPAHLSEPFRPQIELSPAVRLHDTITDDGVFFRTIAATNVLVMPVNFDADSVRLIRYSMPTKLPAYLASGTPILVYGPAGVAQVEDARRNGWGMVVDQPGPATVAAALKELTGTTARGAEFVARARQLVETRHDLRVVRQRFQKRLIAAAR
jgi:glycosyltransferase involved in cell wall biosynthesis